MFQQQSTRQRINRAFRIAYLPDAKRIHSVPVLPTISHSWAHETLAGLSTPASKLLRFLAALNRTGKLGYLGVALDYNLLAERIAAATEIKFSRTSVERGVRELKSKGLITVRPWVREGQYFRAGRHNVLMCGAGTVTLRSGRVMPCRLAIIALTGDALSMWEAPRKGRRRSSVGHEPTPSKLADTSSRSDQIDKSIMVKDPTGEVRTTVQEAGRGSEGRPTRPGGPTVEQRALTGTLELKRRPGAPLQVRQAFDKASRLPPTSPPVAATGCSQDPPVFSRGPQTRGSASVARARILTGLHEFLQNHSPREADAVYCRAKFEIEGKAPKGWPTVVDWNYWIGKWPRLSPKEREVKLYREIVPLLKNREVVAPFDRRRLLGVAVGEAYASPTGGKTKLVNSDLVALVGRLGISDRFSF